jgi:hypothetical protein
MSHICKSVLIALPEKYASALCIIFLKIWKNMHKRSICLCIFLEKPNAILSILAWPYYMHIKHASKCMDKGGN